MNARFTDLSQVEALIQSLDDAADTIDARAGAVVRKVGFDTVRGAQAICPVDTGHLRSSIGVDFDPDGLGFEAGPTANYAHFVEFGTSRMSPQPYLLPVFDQQADLAVTAFGQIVGNIL
ncbi:hypothetical protein BJF79_13820 [Actinomadura sp. CNU-125]|uniref:HK97-gp10 family putative phage morphogenesis protein n=1 Tax=Actinomadura sp. CNU-125 TaxID=1904961 RepID=UPI00095D0AC5|nr:HK97-gp10 family putative phage morphogenesis protein [Actinomadura sp. CNU-125]OLT24415.1 hypothetical protein BJF79_13820 [Actinomadura sp. CNU-125]